jgi:hypothetical protein
MSGESRRQIVKRFVAILVIVLVCACAHAAENVKHDGSWWKEKSGIFKEAFIVGYEEGLAQSKSPAHYADWGTDRTRQIVEGLNVFYDDFRNLKIHVDDAMPYVLSQLSGKTDNDLVPELQRLRSTAAPIGEK